MPPLRRRSNDGSGKSCAALRRGGAHVLHGPALAEDLIESEEVRARVERYYPVFAARHPTRMPPRAVDLAAYIRAVVADWIEE